SRGEGHGGYQEDHGGSRELVLEKGERNQADHGDELEPEASPLANEDAAAPRDEEEADGPNDQCILKHIELLEELEQHVVREEDEGGAKGEARPGDLPVRATGDLRDSGAAQTEREGAPDQEQEGANRKKKSVELVEAEDVPHVSSQERLVVGDRLE